MELRSHPDLELRGRRRVLAEQTGNLAGDPRGIEGHRPGQDRRAHQRGHGDDSLGAAYLSADRVMIRLRAALLSLPFTRRS